jgi:aldehyde dehydrogenase (NAD+)
MSAPHYQQFINGEWVDSAEHYEIRSPATNELVATVAKGTTGDVDAAVAAAKAAHASGVWRNTPPEARRTGAGRLERPGLRLAGRRRERRDDPGHRRCTRFVIAQLQYPAELPRL